MRAPDPLTAWVAAVLREDERAMRRLVAARSSSFLDAADGHGVLCLIERLLRRCRVFDLLPDELRERFVAAVQDAQGVELVRRAELVAITHLLRGCGIPALVLKGAALAYTHYSAPHVRPRLDTDLLIAAKDRARTFEALIGAGYRRSNMVARDVVFTQAAFHRPGVGRVHHVVDVHWRVTNRPLFHDLLPFGELDARAVDVPAIAAKTPCAVDSLLLACIHPVAHHRARWPLIWLNDVSLLAQRLDASQWAEFRDLGASRKVAFVCRYVCELAARCLGGGQWLRDSGMLAVPDRRQFEERSAVYVAGTMDARRELFLDVIATPGLLGKIRLLTAHAFPDLE